MEGNTVSSQRQTIWVQLSCNNCLLSHTRSLPGDSLQSSFFLIIFYTSWMQYECTWKLTYMSNIRKVLFFKHICFKGAFQDHGVISTFPFDLISQTNQKYIYCLCLLSVINTVHVCRCMKLFTREVISVLKEHFTIMGWFQLPFFFFFLTSFHKLIKNIFTGTFSICYL